jgi:phospholipase C
MPRRLLRFTIPALAGAAVAAVAAVTGCARKDVPADRLATATPIKHLVVLYGENVSFDHYFGTYPKAANPPGAPAFTALPNTPAVDGYTDSLLTRNPNLTNEANGSDASNPFRIARTQAGTADQSHDYTAEQLAADGGKMDLFPKYTGRGLAGMPGAFATPGMVMGYFDGNTVTALWNYAQHFAMSDNAHSDQYGPSTPGALNLIAGQTNGMQPVKTSYKTYYVDDGEGGYTMTNDVDPAGDVCSDTMDVVRMTGQNVGELLTAAHVSWGWFEGGFDTTVVNANGSKGCARSTYSAVVQYAPYDYIPHHEPFQYYASTANPTHRRPTSTAMIGRDGDAANHQYDLHDFFDAVKAGNFPAVTFLKASAFQDGHAGYSDPLDEQTFYVQVVNFLMRLPDWKNTAVIILYDDSDGWYDHQFTPVTNASFDPNADRLDGMGKCGVMGTPQLTGVKGAGGVNGRCGPGPRQPFLVISPWARQNYVDHTLITQASVLRFIEDNWLGGERLGGGSFDAGAGTIDGMFDFTGRGNAPTLFLDDTLGVPVAVPSGAVPR